MRIGRVRGSLTDHYSPNEKVLRLSDSVYGSTSVAAIGVAAHECGHAIQHHEKIFPVKAAFRYCTSSEYRLKALVAGYSAWFNHGVDRLGSDWCATVYLCGFLSTDYIAGRVQCIEPCSPCFRRTQITDWRRTQRGNKGFASCCTHLCSFTLFLHSATAPPDTFDKEK